MIRMVQDKNLFQSGFERLTNDAGGPAWLGNLRQSAFARFNELGFPTTRHEEWRHTNVASIAKTSFEAAPAVAARVDVEPFLYGGTDCSLLVFVNGRFAAEQSSLKDLPPGVTVKSLAAACADDRALVEPHLAKHARYENQAFTALNTAFIEDGAFVHVRRGTVVEKPIHFLFVTLSDGRSVITHPRNLVVVEANAQVTLIESYASLDDGAYFTNAVTEFVAGENAVIDHYKVERESDEAFHVATRQVYQSRNSNVSSHTLSFGGGLVRNDINTVLDGEGCNCILNGLSVLHGSQHVDNHLRVDHAKPHCNSWEYFKGILGDRSRGVFSGRIIVREDAQKTNAKQSNLNLLLSDEAMVDTKPQLEILADDVKCTHGATIGQIDENAIFYLRSRGVNEEAARSLLIYAFAGESIGQVRIAPLRDKLQDLLAARLPHGDTLRFGRPFEYSDDFSEIVRSADRRRET